MANYNYIVGPQGMSIGSVLIPAGFVIGVIPPGYPPYVTGRLPQNLPLDVFDYAGVVGNQLPPWDSQPLDQTTYNAMYLAWLKYMNPMMAPKPPPPAVPPFVPPWWYYAVPGGA